MMIYPMTDRRKGQRQKPPRRRFELSVVTGLLGAALALAGCGGGGSVQPPVVPALDRIVYQSTAGGDSEIFIMNGDGTGQTALTNNSAFDADPKFNRAGNKIVFTSNRDGNNEIYMMNADGTNAVNLTRNAASDSDPAISPDGSKIVFVSDRDRTGPSLPSTLELYQLNANGSGVRRLTNNAEFDGDPAFSPDGRSLVFCSRRDGNEEIYRLNLDNLNQAPVNLSRNPRLDRFPNFTPDGARLVFTSDRSGDAEVYIMNADGTNVTDLTNSPLIDTDPVVSPDGRRIIFASARAGTLDIYSMQLNGSGQKPLTSAAGSKRFPDVR
jgi:Tol biopolymer transport system component